MASKRRIRRKSCKGKTRYLDSETASNAMFRLIRTGDRRGGYLHVYHCSFCHGYHFGHAKRATKH